MVYRDWESMLYSEEEFGALYRKTEGFDGEFHRNHPLRPEEMTFGQFMNEGSDLLTTENSELLKMLR